MTKIQFDVFALILGALCLLTGWIIHKFKDYAPLSKIGLIVFGIGLILIGLLDLLFG